MAQPHDEKIGQRAVQAQARIQPKAAGRPHAWRWTLGLALSWLAGQAFCQPLSQPLPAFPPASLADQEQRRAHDREQERERALRQQPTRPSDAPHTTATTAPTDRLPSEAACFVVTQLDLQVHASAGVARPSPDPWHWLLGAAAGPL